MNQTYSLSAYLKTFLLYTLLLVCILNSNGQAENIFFQNAAKRYIINTLEHDLSYYTSIQKYDCALIILNENDTAILNEINALIIADVYLHLQDTPTFKKYFIKHLQIITDYTALENLMLTKKYQFLYPDIDNYVAIIFKNRMKYSQNKNYDYTIKSMMSQDQFVRINPSHYSYIYKVDSINKIKLIDLLSTDTLCVCKSNEYFIPLIIHLSRYDSASFDSLSKYIFNCYPESLKAGIYGLILDNRLQSLYKHQRYYSYLFSSIHPEISNYKEVDENRKKIGLQSLKYDFISYKVKIPIEYEEPKTKSCE